MTKEALCLAAAAAAAANEEIRVSPHGGAEALRRNR